MAHTEQRTTAEQRAALRKRYLSPPAVEMPCVQCDSAMVLEPPERHKSGIFWTWRCPQSPEHGIVGHMDHYGDLDVVAAVDDADALAGALAECERLKRAIREIGASIGFVADMAEDEIGGDSRTGRALERIGEMTAAALAPQPAAKQAENDARMPSECPQDAKSTNDLAAPIAGDSGAETEGIG